MKSTNMQGLVPIVIGVTGHRDIPLADIGALEASCNSVLCDIADKTHNSPHILISCLAEGADRIAARSALMLGWTLGVVLPAPVDVYEKDFLSPESVDEYRELLRSAAWVECVNGATSIIPDYLAAGIRVMQQSQLLMAFWDGKENGLKGGTSDIVKWFMSEIPDSGLGLSGNTPPDARPVIHIKSRRERDIEYLAQDAIGKIEWKAPQPGGMSGEGELARWHAVLRHIDLFNADAQHYCESRFPNIKQSRAGLDSGDPELNTTVFPSLDSSGNMFSLADAMSITAQKEREVLFFLLAGLAMAAIVFEQIYSGPMPSPYVLGPAILFGFVAWSIYKYGTGKRIEERYLDYRSLAEACRVQHFWMSSGIRASVADNFLLEQRDELEWVRQAVRTNELARNIGVLNASDRSDVFENVRNNWITDQCNFFMGTSENSGGNAKLNKWKSDNYMKVSSWFFLAGVSTMIVLLVAQMALAIGEWWVNFGIVTYGLLFAAGGLTKIYQNLKAFDAHSKSYRRGGMLMLRASQRLQAAIKDGDDVLSQRILYETGCEALEENGNWLMLHRERPVTVPLG